MEVQKADFYRDREKFGIITLFCFVFFRLKLKGALSPQERRAPAPGMGLVGPRSLSPSPAAQAPQWPGIPTARRSRPPDSPAPALSNADPGFARAPADARGSRPEDTVDVVFQGRRHDARPGRSGQHRNSSDNWS